MITKTLLVTAWRNHSTLPRWSPIVGNGTVSATISAQAGGNNARTFRSVGSVDSVGSSALPLAGLATVVFLARRRRR